MWVPNVCRRSWKRTRLPPARDTASLKRFRSEPIVGLTLEATHDVGAPGGASGLDSWYDGAAFTLLAGIPSVAYGPSGFRAGGVSVAHTIDEHVPVDDLVTCAQGLAVTAMRFCGAT